MNGFIFTKKSQKGSILGRLAKDSLAGPTLMGPNKLCQKKTRHHYQKALSKSTLSRSPPKTLSI